MKGDFTRDTFRKKKHYRRVPKQQGRVDVDADWNEQVGIEVHHERTSLRDVIGESGAPSENPGFEIIPTDSGYKIGSGHYYVDGILCENENENEEGVDALDQPDLPPLQGLKYPSEPQVFAFPTEPGGIYLAYLHVWERHLTALDDPDIRESALGGPDTATRTKVVWQVQLLRVGGGVSGSIVAKAQVNIPPTAVGQEFLIPFEEGTSGLRKINFRLDEEGGGKSGWIEVIDPNANKDPAEKDKINLNVKKEEGQTGVDAEANETDDNTGEFRVEWRFVPGLQIIQIGPIANDVVGQLVDGDKIIATYTYESGTDLENISCMSQFNDWDKLVTPSSGKLQARSEPETSDTACMILPQAKYTGLENQLYRVEIHDPGIVASNGGTEVPPTFSWSRDNGIVVTKITKIADGRMTVTDTGRDRNLHFLPQQWVEVTDDRHELWGIAGSMVRLVDVQGNDLLFDPDPTKVKGEPITETNFPQKFNPKVRRWDNNGEEGPIEVRIPHENESYIKLESGVQVKFGEGTYHTGDYWLVPARTLKRDIEWPQTETGPEALAPEGIEHHFARLAILRYTGSSIEVISDCRKFFPPAIDRTGAATITTGIITINEEHFEADQPKELNFGPFKHGIENAETPPAIILAKIPDKLPIAPDFPPEDLNNIDNDKSENYVSYMEDRRLYPFEQNPYLEPGPNVKPPAHFKAVGINLKTFKINTQHNQVERVKLKLRFWAISAGKQVDPQECHPGQHEDLPPIG